MRGGRCWAWSGRVVGVVGHGIGFPSATNTPGLPTLPVGFVRVCGQEIGFPSATNFGEFTILNVGLVGVFGRLPIARLATSNSG
jgi:hypothetical protein